MSHPHRSRNSRHQRTFQPNHHLTYISSAIPSFIIRRLILAIVILAVYEHIPGVHYAPYSQIFAFTTPLPTTFTPTSTSKFISSCHEDRPKRLSSCLFGLNKNYNHESRKDQLPVIPVIGPIITAPPLMVCIFHLQIDYLL